MADPWAGMTFAPAANAPAKTPTATAGTTGTANPWAGMSFAPKASPWTGVEKAFGNVASFPQTALLDIIGAPQRAIAGALQQDVQHHVPAGWGSGTYGNYGSQLLGEAGGAAYGVFHPNDPTVEAQAEQAPLIPFVENSRASDLRVANPQNFLDKARNFAVDMGFQTLTDPLTYATGGLSKLGEGALEGFGRAGDRALSAEANPTVRNVAQTFLSNATERHDGFANDVPTLNTTRNAWDMRKARIRSSYEQLLEKHKAALMQGITPPEIGQRHLWEPYVEGDERMRQQALAMGYKPTADEAAHAPLGLHSYNLREAYNPQTGVFTTPKDMADMPLIGEEQDVGAPRAGYEEEQTGQGAAPETLYDRTKLRFAQGAARASYVGKARDFSRKLNVGDEIAQSLAKHPPIPGGIAPLKALSNLQVEALITTGVPHMKNITVNALNSMGEAGAADGARYFMFGVPKEGMERMDLGGASSHFGVHQPRFKYSPSRIIPQSVRNVSQGALDRWDNAMRYARLKALDKSNPEMSEVDKMNRVNEDMGAYGNVPHYIKQLKGIGANFPQWHNYIVPTSVTRAILRNPGRMARLSRYSTIGNQDLLQGANYTVNPGGPNSDYANMLTDPTRLLSGQHLSYFTSPSSIGPVASALTGGGNKPTPYGISDFAQYLGQLFPGGNILEEALSNPYHEPVSPAQRAIMSLFGIYTQNNKHGVNGLQDGSSPAASMFNGLGSGAPP